MDLAVLRESMIVDIVRCKPVRIIAGNDVNDFHEPKILFLIVVMSSKHTRPLVFIDS